MKNKFAYIIYNTLSLEVYETFLTEEECVNKFNKYYQAWEYVDWKGINLTYILKEVIKR